MTVSCCTLTPAEYCRSAVTVTVAQFLTGVLLNIVDKMEVKTLVVVLGCLSLALATDTGKVRKHIEYHFRSVLFACLLESRVQFTLLV